MQRKGQNEGGWGKSVRVREVFINHTELSADMAASPLISVGRHYISKVGVLAHAALPHVHAARHLNVETRPPLTDIDMG